MSAPRPSPSAAGLGKGQKLAVIAAIVAFTTGLSGVFMGLLQTERSARIIGETRQHFDATLSPTVHESPASAAIAPLYSDLPDRTRQPNHDWHSHLGTLPPAAPFTATTPPLTDAEAAALLVRRASRRAFNGAPPTVPHPIDQYHSASCLACHGKPTRIGAIDTPQMSHPAYTHCIQCHAPANGPGPALVSPPPALATPILANAFTGFAATTRGTRAHTDAPPTVPHTTAMRENCLACHGPGGSSAFKPTHPERQNCVQCHALDARRETLPLLGTSTLPPLPTGLNTGS
jgi:cytochrome c-type protein NapB